MSEAALIASLQDQLAKANSEAKRHRLARRAAREELATLRSQVESLTGERDAVQAKLEANPGELQAEVDRLQGQLRDRDHRAAWAGVGDKLADKVTLDKVWAELQYTPGDQVPTPEQITEQLGRLQESAPYLLRPVADATTVAPGGAKATQEPTVLPPGPGYGRGTPANGTGFFSVRAADLADPSWMALNQGHMAKANAEGRLRFAD